MVVDSEDVCIDSVKEGSRKTRIGGTWFPCPCHYQMPQKQKWDGSAGVESEDVLE